MNRKLKLTFSSLMLCCLPLFLSANENQHIIYYVVNEAAAPLQISSGPPSETKKGIITDIVELLESPTLHFKHRVLPKKRMLLEMMEQKTPWVSYGSSTWPGPQSLSLSETPLLQTQHYFLTNKNFTYEGFEQLFGERLILIRGYDYPGLDKYINSGKFKTIIVSNHKAAISALVARRGVAIPDMGFRLLYNIDIHGYNKDSFQFTDISWLIPSQDINLCFSLNFPHKEKKQIEAKLKELAQEGKLKQVVNNYLN